MEYAGKSGRIAVFAFCSACVALAITFGLYYLTDYTRKKKKGSATDVFKSSSKVRGHESATSFEVELELAEILKANGHGEFTRGTISSLLELLERVEDHMLEKLLVALLNCSAFTTNQVVCPPPPTHPHSRRGLPIKMTGVLVGNFEKNL